MKILCAISGIEFQCEHFPATLHSREATHPIFNIPQKKLISFVSKWSGNELTQTDSYLLFLALLDSTELINWKTPVHITTNTPSIVANNMEPLLHCIGKINIVKDHTNLPQFVVNQDTKTLYNIRHWIEAWEVAIQDYKDGYRQADLNERLKRREQALERIIRANKNYPSKFAGTLAEWAAQAGYFPEFEMEFRGELITCSEYWKRIIKACVNEERIFNVPSSDLEELISHCEDNIPHGTTYAFTLMQLLRDGRNKQRNFLDLGDIDISGSTFRILDADTSTQDANIKALIDSAPIDKPERKDYPSDFAHLRAKVKWEMAQRYRKNEDTKENDNGTH